MSADKDQIVGRAKQAAGSLAGDDDLKEDGEQQETAGDAKEKINDAADSVKDGVDKLKDSFGS